MKTKKEEFEEKVKELANSNSKTEEPVYFGYRHESEDGSEIYTVTDFGNIWSWIEQNYISREELLSKLPEERKGTVEHIPCPDGIVGCAVYHTTVRLSEEDKLWNEYREEVIKIINK